MQHGGRIRRLDRTRRARDTLLRITNNSSLCANRSAGVYSATVWLASRFRTLRALSRRLLSRQEIRWQGIQARRNGMRPDLGPGRVVQHRRQFHEGIGRLHAGQRRQVGLWFFPDRPRHRSPEADPRAVQAEDGRGSGAHQEDCRNGEHLGGIRLPPNLGAIAPGAVRLEPTASGRGSAQAGC